MKTLTTFSILFVLSGCTIAEVTVHQRSIMDFGDNKSDKFQRLSEEETSSVRSDMDVKASLK